MEYFTLFYKDIDLLYRLPLITSFIEYLNMLYIDNHRLVFDEIFYFIDKLPYRLMFSIYSIFYCV